MRRAVVGLDLICVQLLRRRIDISEIRLIGPDEEMKAEKDTDQLLSKAELKGLESEMNLSAVNTKGSALKGAKSMGILKGTSPKKPTTGQHQRL